MSYAAPDYPTPTRPTKAAMLQALRTARAELRLAEAAIKAGDTDVLESAAEAATGAASVLWHDARLLDHLEWCEDDGCTHDV